MKVFFVSLLIFPLVAFSSVREMIGTYQSPESSQTEIPPECLDQPTPIPQREIKGIVNVEFLYWYGNVTNLYYARQFKLTPNGDVTDPTAATFTPVKFKRFNWEWDPGVRLGLGLVTNHDGWDLYSNWTYFYNSTERSSSVPQLAGRDLPTTTVNPAGTKTLKSPWLWLPHHDSFQRIKGKWSLLFNQVDLTMGRHYGISHRLSLHPFAGVRGYWARMTFLVKAFRPFIPGPSLQNQIQSRVEYKQHSWAVGLLGGLNTTWHLTDHWSLFSGVDVALAYGKYDVKKRLDNLQIRETGRVPFRDVHYTTFDTLYRLQSFLDLSLGLRYETLLYQTYRLLFDLGWESHFLLNFSRLFVGTYPSDSTTDYPSSKGNLTLSGVTFRGMFEF